MNQAYFAAGCFWGVEAVFQKTNGVHSVISGYAGGHKESPTYQEVVQGNTGHLEAVEVTYDSEEVSFEHLVEIFFRMHDPTQIGGQGPDIGPQYLSAIFAIDGEQETQVQDLINNFEKKQIFEKPIVTKVLSLKKFYPAEEYHQNYYEKTGGTPYCHVLRPTLSLNK